MKKIILVLSFCTVILGYSCWEYVQYILSFYLDSKQAEEYACKFFFTCVEAGFVGYTYYIMVEEKDKNSFWFRFKRMIFSTTLANLVDRLVGDLYTISKLEYIFFTLNVILLFIDGRKINTVGIKIRQLRKNFR